MSIRLKVALCLLAVMVVLQVVVATVGGGILTARFAALETREIRQELVNLDEALGTRFAGLDAKVVDWSMWGGCHDYLAAPDEAFVEAMVTPSWMDSGRLDLIAFFDAAGSFVSGRLLAGNGQRVEPIPDPIANRLMAYRALTDHRSPESAVHGLVAIDGEPWLAAGRPSLDDEGEGPIHGSVVIARRLPGGLLADLSRSFGRDLAINPMEHIGSDIVWGRAREAISAGDDLPVIVVDDATVSGFLPLRDLESRPRWLMRLDAGRQVWAAGQSARRAHVLFMGVVALALAALAWVLLELLLLRRLARLERQVADMATGHERVEVSGGDEVGRLAQAYNRLLEDLDRAASAMQAARDEATIAADAKIDLLSAVSHELRTPLTGILGMVRLLAREPLERQAREYVEVMRTSGDNILALVNDLLDVSRLESGKFNLERMVFEPRLVLEEAVQLGAERAEAKGIEIASIVDSSLPRHVEGDPARFRQIVHNLIGNALRFTDQGEVVVRLLPDPSRSSATEVGLRLVVRDTGGGIPRAIQDRLFQRRQDETDSSTTRRGSGSGLGLTICRHLAERMGGGLFLEGSGDEGSTVTVTLRMTRIPMAPGSSDSSGGFPSRHVLVVARHAATREGLRHALRSVGFDCEEASDLDQARLLRSGGADYALALVDLALAGPDLRPKEAAVELAAIFPGLPVVILTASGSRSAVTEARAARGVLAKPVQRVHLVEVLRRIGSGTDDQDASVDPQGEDRSGQGLRALVVDDSHINQRVAAGMLRRLGCQVDVAGQGLEGLQMLRRRRYDLVILDCQMPVMDGYVMTQQWRSEEDSSRRVLIVALTADATAGARDRCLQAGMDDYLTKPVEFETLAATVRRSLSRRSDGSGKLPAISDSSAKHRQASGELDREMLDQVRILGEDGFRRVIDRYLEAMPKRLVRLGEVMAADDLEQVGVVAHQIVGESGLVGLRRVEHLAREIEVAARSERRILKGHLDTLRIAYQTGCDLLMQVRDEPA